MREVEARALGRQRIEVRSLAARAAVAREASARVVSSVSEQDVARLRTCGFVRHRADDRRARGRAGGRESASRDMPPASCYADPGLSRRRASRISHSGTRCASSASSTKVANTSARSPSSIARIASACPSCSYGPRSWRTALALDEQLVEVVEDRHAARDEVVVRRVVLVADERVLAHRHARDRRRRSARGGRPSSSACSRAPRPRRRRTGTRSRGSSAALDRVAQRPASSIALPRVLRRCPRRSGARSGCPGTRSKPSQVVAESSATLPRVAATGDAERRGPAAPAPAARSASVASPSTEQPVEEREHVHAEAQLEEVAADGEHVAPYTRQHEGERRRHAPVLRRGAPAARAAGTSRCDQQSWKYAR